VTASYAPSAQSDAFWLVIELFIAVIREKLSCYRTVTTVSIKRVGSFSDPGMPRG